MTQLHEHKMEISTLVPLTPEEEQRAVEDFERQTMKWVQFWCKKHHSVVLTHEIERSPDAVSWVLRAYSEPIGVTS